MTATLVAGSISLVACEQSFNDEARNGSASFAGAAPTDGQSDETKNLARSVGLFIAASTPGNTAYKIGPQDVLEIVVFKVPDLTRSVQVSDTGTINLPLVGEVGASGRTSQELERDLTARLGATYLKSPQISVYVKEFNSQRVTVEGAVKKPGVYPVRSKNSLVQLVAVAGGLDRDTASNTIMVFRTRDGQRLAAQFDLDEIREGRAEDPAVQDGDVIVVPTSAAKVVLSSFLRVTPALAAFRPSVW